MNRLPLHCGGEHSRQLQLAKGFSPAHSFEIIIQIADR